METMALKGKPRDMNKWREVLLDPNVHFPGESSDYRRARNELLEAEAELRRLNEQVAAQRRALPAGGLIKEDYVFESAADGSKVRFSELFAPGRNSLVIYNMMFPRWSEDRRAGVPRLDMLSRIVRSPVEICFGTSPSQAPKQRATKLSCRCRAAISPSTPTSCSPRRLRAAGLS